MKFVIQRVMESEVKVEGETLGKIGKGFMVLIGVSNSDTKEIADRMVKKMLGLRIFEDEQGKTNLSLDAVGGSLLLISQFTLYANCKKGNRPSFIEAGAWKVRSRHESQPGQRWPVHNRPGFRRPLIGDGGFLKIPRPQLIFLIKVSNYFSVNFLHKI